MALKQPGSFDEWMHGFQIGYESERVGGADFHHGAVEGRNAASRARGGYAGCIPFILGVAFLVWAAWRGMPELTRRTTDCEARGGVLIARFVFLPLACVDTLPSQMDRRKDERE